jgi:hypothetical protein
MANKPVWSPGEKATAVGAVSGVLAGLTAAIISAVNTQIDKENREGNR